LLMEITDKFLIIDSQQIQIPLLLDIVYIDLAKDTKVFNVKLVMALHMPFTLLRTKEIIYKVWNYRGIKEL